jgi:tRNA(adenine34) deaminase
MADLTHPDDERWMREALREAQAAFDEGEVPVGAVVVRGGRVVARGRNQIELLQDATAHAEILAIGAASTATESWRLLDATLYVTLEPCPMCAGAILLARIERVVFGASDPEMGAAGSRLDIFSSGAIRHRAVVTGGVLDAECGSLIREFFARRRKGVIPGPGRRPT